MEVKFQELLAYTDWERNQWRDWFSSMGRAVLDVSTGGERHKSVAELIKHIFAVEMRYIQRLKGEPLTPYNAIPIDSAESLFDFGYESRAAFKEFLSRTPDLNLNYEFSVLDVQIRAPIRKFVIHVLIHEIRHWAQVALLLRQAGYEELGEHDFINSEG
jgi:uncharacterized damage-inducible protein DinB